MMKVSVVIFCLCWVTAIVRSQSNDVENLERIVAQHRGDTAEARALLELGVLASNEDIQSAKKYFKQALRLSEKISSPEHVAESYIELGYIYHTDGQSDSALFFNRKALWIAPVKTRYAVDAYRGMALNLLWLSQFDSARTNLQKALSIATEIEDYSLQAGVHNELGNLALEESDKHEALRQYLLSAKIQDSLLQDPVGVSRALLNIGNIQYQLQDNDKALQYAMEGQQIAEKNGYYKGQAYGSQLMGRIYRSQQKQDKALIAFTEAVDIYNRMGDRRSSVETQLSIGNIYFDKSDFEKAKFTYFNALKEAKRISNQALKYRAFSTLGFVFLQQKQYAKSAIYADSSRMEALAIKSPHGVLEAYDLLMSIHEEQHHYKEALKYSMLHSALKDSLTTAENRTVVAELEIKYQNETKAAEIELLKADKGLKEAMISRQRTIQIATVVVLVLVIIVALVLINRYRIVNNARQMVEIERVRNGIARDLHDDVGSTLSSINILSKVALAEKNGSIDDYLQRIGDQSSRMMEDISDIVWSIAPNNDTIEKVTIRMREFATEILEPKNIRYRFYENISEGLTLDADKRKNVFLIFKESVNNAAKYSQANQVDIYLQQRDNFLVMNIKDDGIGFDESLVKTGNGLKNLRERAREINATVTMKSWRLKGTEIELILPLT